MSRSICRARFDVLESRQLLSAVSFTIDSSASELTVTSTADVSHTDTFSLKPQADGLDSASLEGTLKADISTKGVRFNGGSDIAAIDHAGSYSPDSKPAAFAIKGHVKKFGITLATATAAVRGLSFDLTSSSRKKPASNHKFAIRNGEAKILDGTADYKLDSKFGDGSGSKSLADLETAISNDFAKVIGAKGSRTITVPIDITYTKKFSGSYSGTFRLRGQIVGHETGTSSAQAFVATTTTPETKHRSHSDLVSTLDLV